MPFNCLTAQARYKDNCWFLICRVPQMMEKMFVLNTYN